ncbi:MAG: SirB2 family protein [Gammaproteobacteria bacterium]|nr:SirB2 family protein [Gammaproteobacteria bacterium]
MESPFAVILHCLVPGGGYGRLWAKAADGRKLPSPSGHAHAARPHVVDTLLLAAGLALALIIREYPFVNSWLTAKLPALIAYVAAGRVAVRRGLSPRRRAASAGCPPGLGAVRRRPRPVRGARAASVRARAGARCARACWHRETRAAAHGRRPRGERTRRAGPT